MLQRPLVLCIAGHDPVGGAGIQADIEAVKASGAQAVTVIAALTVQDSTDVRALRAVEADWLAAQLDCLLADCRIAAIKIGLLGDAAQLGPILRAIRAAQVPVVCDTVLRAGGGRTLAAESLQRGLLERLLPAVTVATPNAAEARRLAPEAPTLEACAAALLATGCGHVLITGGDEPDAGVHNRWYGGDGTRAAFEWPRLPETFHGAGCTLSAALAARLALGLAPLAAAEAAQRDTQRWLGRALAVGRGRRIPDRGP